MAERTLLSTAHEVVARPTLFVDGFLEDPYAIYRQFQSQGSIHYLQWAEACDHWTVFSYAGIWSVVSRLVNINIEISKEASHDEE